MPNNKTNKEHLFFSGLALLISLLAASGFWFTYFGPIISDSYPPSGMPLHIHGWSFFLWLVLFPVQAILIGRRRRSLHKLLGKASVVLVLIMTATGVLVVSVRANEAVTNGAPLVWLYYSPVIFSNLVLFVAFYAASIRAAMTNRWQAHKRLMIVASAIGVGAGISRWVMVLSGFHPLSIPIGVIACSVFIIIGIIYDIAVRRSVHPAYWAGILAFIVVMLPLLPQVSEGNVAFVNQWLAALGEHLGFLYDPEPTVEF